MLKKILFLSILCFAARLCYAQSSADSVYSKFSDFNLAMLDNDAAHAVELGEAVLPKIDKLAPSTQIRFYDGLAKMYEKNYQPDKAIIYFSKVANAVPDYYVAHRALGYLYLKPLQDIYKRYQAAQGHQQTQKSIAAEYKTAAIKALPHLEKAQACDPSDETLQIIKNIYNNLDDHVALNSLDNRLKQLSSNCVDLLKE